MNLQLTSEREQLLDEMVTAYFKAVKAGEVPDRAEWLARHPELAEDLRQFFADQDEVEGVAGPLRAAVRTAPAELVFASGCLGDYRILREIGRGGMGVVYEAEQISLNRRIALKVLPFAAAMDHKHLQRFKNEAQAAAHLHHGHIVPVYSVGCERGVHYYAMQFIEGEPLSNLIRELREQRDGKKVDELPATAAYQSGEQRAESQEPNAESAERGAQTAEGPLSPSSLAGEGRGGGAAGGQPTRGQPPVAHVAKSPVAYAPGSPKARSTHSVDTVLQAALSTQTATQGPAFFQMAATLGIEAAEALEHAHDQGVIHRDIKPANLIVDVRGQLWITDFGLAQFQADAGLTMTGDLMGTLRYMSPEQAMAKRLMVDHRTDVYSLGVTLYELLVLEPPFKGDNRAEILRQVCFEEPKALRKSNKHIPADLETIVMKAMEKNPIDRYGTAQELADDLRRFLEHKTIKARRATVAQRVRKWARRHRPVVWAAGVSAVTLLVLATITLAVGNLLLTHEQQQTQAAKDALEQGLYFSQIALAERAWVANDMSRATQLLAACPPGLRGWEWGYLERLRRGGLPPLRHEGPVRSVAFSPDGRWLASGSMDGSVKLWDTVTWREVRTFPHTAVVDGVAFSPDSQRLATACWDGAVRVWESNSGRLVYTLHGPSEYLHRVVFSPDGRYLASGGGNDDELNAVTIWDTATGQPLRYLKGHEANGRGLAFSPDSQRLVFTGSKPTVTILDVVTGRVLSSLPGPDDDELLSVACSRDGRFVAAAGGHFMTGQSRDILVWDIETGEMVRRLSGHTAAVISVAFSPDGQRLASGGEDLGVKLWDVGAGTEALTLQGHRNAIWEVAFSPNGHRLVSAGTDGDVRVWDATPLDGERVELRTLRGHAKAVYCVAFSADGDRLASGSLDRTVRIWDAISGEQRMRLDFAASMGGVMFSPDSRWLAAAGLQDALVVLDTLSWREKFHMRDGGSNRAVFSPDSQRIATDGMDFRIKVWDLQSRRMCMTFPGHRWAVWGLAFSPDGRTLASASNDRTVKIWDVSTGQEFRPLLALSPSAAFLYGLVATATALTPMPVVTLHHPDSVWGAAFSPREDRLASGGSDRTIRIWDTKTWKEIASFRDPSGGITAIAYSPDGRRIATGGTDSTVKLWDATTGELLRTYYGHTNWVFGVTFSPDGLRLASGSRDGTVKIWAATLPEPPIPAAVGRD